MKEREITCLYGLLWNQNYLHVVCLCHHCVCKDVWEVSICSVWTVLCQASIFSCSHANVFCSSRYNKWNIWLSNPQINCLPKLPAQFDSTTVAVALVQSLNSPFFLPHIGTEPGQVKRESTITFMPMLRTNQSKITRSQPYYAARVNVSRNAFFSSRSE